MATQGTVTYTDVQLVFSRDELNKSIQTWPLFFEQWDAVSLQANIFSYWGGALYGMLLDDFGVNWRPYAFERDFGLMLKEALGITELRPLEEIDLERFGYSEIAARINAAN